MNAYIHGAVFGYSPFFVSGALLTTTSTAAAAAVLYIYIYIVLCVGEKVRAECILNLFRGSRTTSPDHDDPQGAGNPVARDYGETWTCAKGARRPLMCPTESSGAPLLICFRSGGTKVEKCRHMIGQNKAELKKYFVS